MNVKHDNYTQHEDEISRTYLSIASTMNAIRLVSDQDFFYEVLSDSVVWKDETQNMPSAKSTSILRPLFHYRSSLMLASPDARCEPYWRLGLKHFPDWIGFNPSRIHPTVNVRQCLIDGRSKLKACFDSLD